MSTSTSAWVVGEAERMHVQVLTPYEEARCHVEAWPQYPDALMISNMIAGTALPSPGEHSRQHCSLSGHAHAPQHDCEQCPAVSS